MCFSAVCRDGNSEAWGEFVGGLRQLFYLGIVDAETT